MPLNRTPHSRRNARGVQTLRLEQAYRPCPPETFRRPLRDWLTFGIPWDRGCEVAPCTVAAAYRRLFRAEPRRGRLELLQTRVYSLRELRLIALALEVAS